ncbi:MAG: phosphoribosylaminoimidazolesuccinocarboxamide synthase [Candidatus Nanopelagicaceae bacterium]|nr:phosphoribosylaminoimidazolesuccinocarboxamide synthase [Candidatus Nanopelagicaceae bacterium]
MSGFGLRGAPAAPEVAGWTHLRTGKVRDLYTNDKNELLIVASDRISAFDWVLPTEIPNKGKLLTQISLFWFELLSDIVPNHVISTDVPATVVGRAVIAKPLQMFAIECVARGYLTGSGWIEYKSNQEVCGNKLPAGLTDGSKLPESIFTPATKAEIGHHDININFAQAAEIVGKEDATELKRLTLALYDRAKEYAALKDIILVDTKFEFGRDASGTITLGDEALTPDSSRFWDQDRTSFDKQYLRDYLANVWDKESEPPTIPQEIVEKTAARYEEALFRLTGKRS